MKYMPYLIFTLYISLFFPSISRGNRVEFVAFSISDSTAHNARVSWLAETTYRSDGCFGNRTTLKTYPHKSLTYVYFDSEYYIGVVIDNMDPLHPLEKVDCEFENWELDPVGDIDPITKKNIYPTGRFFVNLRNSFEETAIQNKKYAKFTVDEKRSMADQVIDKYFSEGGHISLSITYKNEATPLYFQLIPERYGFIGVNNAYPIALQLSVQTDLKSGMNLYYPMQIVGSNGNRKNRINWTWFSKSISFGPYALFDGTNPKGFGALVGFGAPYNPPFIAFGFGEINKDGKARSSGSIVVNPLELFKIALNPKLLGDN